MRVSTKSDYALRALIEITRRDDVVSAEQVGASQDIPHGFLQSILADLRRAGLVASQRGQSGGWRMATDPADVSVADVIRAVDGPLLSVYGVRPESVSLQRVGQGAADRVGGRAAQPPLGLRDGDDRRAGLRLATGRRRGPHRRRGRLEPALIVLAVRRRAGGAAAAVARTRSGLPRPRRAPGPRARARGTAR